MDKSLIWAQVELNQHINDVGQRPLIDYNPLLIDASYLGGISHDDVFAIVEQKLAGLIINHEELKININEYYFTPLYLEVAKEYLEESWDGNGNPKIEILPLNDYFSTQYIEQLANLTDKFNTADIMIRNVVNSRTIDWLQNAGVKLIGINCYPKHIHARSGLAPFDTPELIKECAMETKPGKSKLILAYDFDNTAQMVKALYCGSDYIDVTLLCEKIMNHRGCDVIAALYLIQDPVGLDFNNCLMNAMLNTDIASLTQFTS